jgi:hypothetical protein
VVSGSVVLSAQSVVANVKASFAFRNVEVVRDNLNGFIKDFGNRLLAFVRKKFCRTLNFFDVRACEALVVAKGFLRWANVVFFEIKVNEHIDFVWRWQFEFILTVEAHRAVGNCRIQYSCSLWLPRDDFFLILIKS